MITNLLYRIQKRPIIILGNQKSGTTAIAALLAKRTGLSATLDTSILWDPNLSKLLAGELRLKDVISQNRKPFSRKIIKEPNLTFFMDDLRDVFPDAHYVFIVRDPRDNIRSLLNRVQLSGKLTKLEESNDIPKGWKSLFDGHFSQSNHYIEELACRWNFCIQQYKKMDDDCELVRYEDFVKSKSAAIDLLCDRLGLEKEHNIDKVVNVQYQPPGNQSVSWENFFSLDNYNRINDICGDNARSLGYD